MSEPIIKFRKASIWDILSQITFLCLIFSGSFYIKKGLPVALYFFYFLIPPLLFYYLLKFRSLNKYLLLFFSITGASGILLVFNGANTLAGFLKIYISVAVMYSFSYYLIKHYRFKIHDLFILYLKGAKFIVFIAFIQLISYLVGFRPGYDFTWLLTGLERQLIYAGRGFRAHSILGEPSFYALVLTPAMFTAFCRLIYYKNYSHILKKSEAVYLIVGFLISGSSSGFMALFFAFLIISLKKISFFKVILGLSVGCGILYTIYNVSDDFRLRLENSLALMLTSNIQTENVDVSSFTLFNHTMITIKNLSQHPIFGSGFGSHPIAYDKYSLAKGESILHLGMILNREDANSLLLRLLSETGLFGTLVFMLYLYKFRVREADKPGNSFWLISNSILVLFFITLLRNGHYFLNGVSVFFFMYYYNYLDSLNGRNSVLPEDKNTQ